MNFGFLMFTKTISESFSHCRDRVVQKTERPFNISGTRGNVIIFRDCFPCIPQADDMGSILQGTLSFVCVDLLISI